MSRRGDYFDDESRDEDDPVPLDELLSLDDEPVPLVEPVELDETLLLSLFSLSWVVFFFAPSDSPRGFTSLASRDGSPVLLPGFIAPELLPVEPLVDPALPPWPYAGADASRNIDPTKTLSLRI